MPFFVIIQVVMFSIRSVLKVGGLTFISRVLGYVRDMLVATLFGTGMVADAWFVAMRLPNLFRRLFAEGAFNSAFVPMFARRLEENGEQQARIFGEQVLSLMVVLLLGLTVLAEIFMPLLILIFAPGFVKQPDKFTLTVIMTGITFPYLLFMSLCALQGGILNSLHRFGHAAAAPILLNVVLIAALIFVVPDAEAPGPALVWGVAVAGVVQFLWLFWACRHAGMSLKLPRPQINADMKQLAKLMIPGIISGGITQINIMIATILASLQDQAVSYLSYADRLYQLPLALIGSAIGVVLLPSMARALRNGQEELAMAGFNRCLEFALLLTLPAAVGLVLAAEPIIRVFFEHGRFTAESTHNTALALIAVSIGLPAYVLNKALTPAFYAREDMTTPFRFALIAVGVDIVLSLILFYFFGFVGIALATAIAAWINCAQLYVRLRKWGHLVIDERLKHRFPRMVIANIVLGLALVGGEQLLQPWLNGKALEGAVALAVLIAGAMAIYAASTLTLKAYPWSELKAAFRRR